MKKKVNPTESGKAARRKGSKEVNPFESEEYARSRKKSSAHAADGKSRANPFMAAESSIKEDTVSFEYAEAPADDDFIEAPASEEAEPAKTPSRRRKASVEADNLQDSSSAEAEAEEAPSKDSPKRIKSEPTPAESEAAAKKIWLIESALAVLASFLAIIVASIY